MAAVKHHRTALNLPHMHGTPCKAFFSELDHHLELQVRCCQFRCSHCFASLQPSCFCLLLVTTACPEACGAALQTVICTHFWGIFVTPWLPWQQEGPGIHYNVLGCCFPGAQNYELQLVMFCHEPCYKLNLDLKLIQQCIFVSWIPCTFSFYSFFPPLIFFFLSNVSNCLSILVWWD